LRDESSKKKVVVSDEQEFGDESRHDDQITWRDLFLRGAEYGLMPEKVLSYDVEFIEIIFRGLATRQQHLYNLARIVATAIYQVNSSKPVLASELFELPLIDGQRERIDPEELKKRAIKLFKLGNDGTDCN
jgi:hypothetical protein